MASSKSVITTADDLPQDLKGLKHISSGKVREIYEVDDKTLLFVATDRISAYDVILQNGVPQKGAILTSISEFWFKYLTSQIPSLRTHYLSTSPPRSMKVKKLKILPIEAIVRGYITGSAWSSYRKDGMVNGVRLPEGLRESQKLPQPMFTPSTKAEQGMHDENISISQMREIIGAHYAKRVEELSLQLYETAATYAETKGIIIADTKFEFGVDDDGEVVLCDEVLTPDSSRFWDAEKYEVGKTQDSFDKQYLRDWLTREGLKGKEGVSMTEEVCRETARKYQEAYERITGEAWR